MCLKLWKLRLRLVASKANSVKNLRLNQLLIDIFAFSNRFFWQDSRWSRRPNSNSLGWTGTWRQEKRFFYSLAVSVIKGKTPNIIFWFYVISGELDYFSQPSTRISRYVNNPIVIWGGLSSFTKPTSDCIVFQEWPAKQFGAKNQFHFICWEWLFSRWNIIFVG